jgi:ABC-type lipoprotein export system ATPase subunit
MSNKLISLKNITKDYQTGEVTTSVLKGVSFEIEEGEFVAIMGASGS